MTVARQNISHVPDPFNQLNDPGEVFKNPQQNSFVRILIGIIRSSFDSVVRSNQATPQIVLRAPDGSAWVVEVSNTGVISTRNARA